MSDTEKQTPTDDEIVEQTAQQFAGSAIRQHKEQALKTRVEARFRELMAAAGIPEITDEVRFANMKAQYLIQLENADLDKRAQQAARDEFNAKQAAN